MTAFAPFLSFVASIVHRQVSEFSNHSSHLAIDDTSAKAVVRSGFLIIPLFHANQTLVVLLPY